MFEPTHSITTQMSPDKCSNSCFSKTPMPSPKKQNEFRKTPSLCFAKVVKHPRSKEAKLARNLRKYPMLEPCSCYYDCREHFTDEQRAAYHLEFWQKNYQEQFKFLTHFVYEFNKKQDTSEKRLYRRQYSLHNYEFHQQCKDKEEFPLIYRCYKHHKRVCQRFFLTTLGLKSAGRIDTALKKKRNNVIIEDRRGGKRGGGNDF